MVKTAVLLGAKDEEEARVQMSDVLRLEIKLAEASAPREERRNASLLYNPEYLSKYFFKNIYLFKYIFKDMDVFHALILMNNKKYIIGI